MATLVRAVTRAKGEAATDELVSGLEQALGGRSPALLVCLASMQQPLETTLRALRRAFPGAAIIGSSTAGEFTEEGEHELATIVAGVVGDLVVHTSMAEGIKGDPEGAATRAVAALPPRSTSHPHRTALLFFDGLVGVGEEITLSCAIAIGADVRIVGAAAGDDWQIQGTIVGAGERAALDSLAIAVLDSKRPLGIGVAHGHKPIGAPRLKVTRSEGSVVHELDGKPAWSRYVEVTREHASSNWNTDPDTITDAGKRLQYFAWYQTGIEVEGGIKNRTPLSKLDDGSLAYACGIPEGTVLEVLASDLDQQLESACEAGRLALADLGAAPSSGLVFECGCRKVYLGDRFSEAPRRVSAVLGGIPLVGLEAYGEVALNVGDFSGFHNATTVVLLFPEED